MIDHLIAFVVRKDPQELLELNLQDVGLCQAWVLAQHAGTDGADRVNAFLEHWRAQKNAGTRPTAGQRSQMILRSLIDDLKRGGPAAFSPAEVRFLCAVHDLLQIERIYKASARVVELLDPEMPALRKRLETVAGSDGFSALSMRQSYVSAREIAAAPAMDTRTLAGIELPCRGPVMKFSNHVRVLDDVPDNCTLVVEGMHHCAVDGYVMGRVLSKQHCDVMLNVSGVIIVLQGDIRVRGIVNNARVISKMGSVHCHSAQGPKLVFGGKSIHVQEHAVLGTYITRVLTVGGEVRGGQLHLADQGSAARFLHMGQNTLEILLRRDLHCEDYGETAGVELRRLLSRAFRLRRAAHNYTTLSASARQEAEYAAQGILMYLFGGGETHKKLEDYLQTQRRLSLINRILDNATVTVDGARDKLSAQGVEDKEDIPEPAMADLDEEQVDDDLKLEHEEVAALRKNLDSAALDRRQTNLLIDQARERIARLTAERDVLQEQLKHKEKSIQSLENYEKVLAASASGTNSKIKVLQKILPAIRKQPENSPLAMAARAPFIVKSLGVIERKVRYIRDNETKRKAYIDEFRTVSDKLHQDFQVRVLEETGDSTGVTVTGEFAEGVRIAVLESPGSLPVPDDAFLTTDGAPGTRTYYRVRNSAKVLLR